MFERYEVRIFPFRYVCELQGDELRIVGGPAVDGQVIGAGGVACRLSDIGWGGAGDQVELWTLDGVRLNRALRPVRKRK